LQCIDWTNFENTLFKMLFDLKRHLLVSSSHFGAGFEIFTINVKLASC